MSSTADPRPYSLEDPSGTRLRLNHRYPWLLRRGWVVLVSLVVVVLVATVVGEHRPVSYSAEAKVQVTTGAQGPSRVGGATPGSPQEAQALAADYAGLITADTRILAKVASATGLSKDQVPGATSVSVVNGTSILDIRFTASSPGVARIGATSMALAISGKSPVTPAIPPKAVFVTLLPTTVSRHVTKLPIVVGVGAALGLLLGIVLLITWERADARFDRPGQVSGTLAIPARSLADLNYLSAIALMDRWRRMTDHRPANVAFVPAVPDISYEALELVRRLGLVSHFSPLSVRTSLDTLPPDGAGAGEAVPLYGGRDAGARDGRALMDDPSADDADLLLLPSGAPGAEGGEAAAVHADVTVLVVPRGSRVRDVRQASILLEQVGVRPQWALMVDLRRLQGPPAEAFELSHPAMDRLHEGTSAPAHLQHADGAD